MQQLTQREADRLIAMLKRKLDDTIYEFPRTKGKIIFEVVGDGYVDEFIINISRKGSLHNGCSYQGRLKKDNITLFRIDINPSRDHVNPDGKAVIGSHYHIYNEKTKTSVAIPFNEDTANLYELCFVFLGRFNVIEPPMIVSKE
jgi:hypothetical protein